MIDYIKIMTRLGALYGPDITFLSIDRCDIDDAKQVGECDVVIIGAPYDGGTSYRSGTRFGPHAIRITDYIPHDQRRPHLALGVDPFQALTIKDAGDICMPPTDIMISLNQVKESVKKIVDSGAIPVILGGDHSITYADGVGVADSKGYGKFGMIHFDAHPDTADLELDQPHGHGQWVRRLIESGAIKGSNFVQFGIRGYWPGNDVLNWMANQKMRAYEMSEIGDRGIKECIQEAASIASEGTDGIFLSIDVDVCDPAYMPATGTPEPGGLTSRELLDSVREICLKNPIVGIDIVELNPSYDHADISAMLANRVILEALSAIAARKVGGRNQYEPLLNGR